MREWSARYDAGRRESGKEFRSITNMAGLRVKTEWRRSWSGLRHAPSLADAITYDLTSRGMAVHEVEVGPDKDRRQGALGNLIEFGSINNPPHPAGLRAALREEPRFVRAAERAGEAAAGG
jgi:hypothetical protein